MQTLPSLTSFVFEGSSVFGSEDEDVPLPEEGWLPSTTLTDLYICNIKSLNNWGLQFLISLRHLQISDCLRLQSLPEQGFPATLSSLEISNCRRLKSLPEEGLPASLSKLCISKCPLLELNIGEHWQKIAHIPFIEIGYRVIC